VAEVLECLQAAKGPAFNPQYCQKTEKKLVALVAFEEWTWRTGAQKGVLAF
jgi:hypothetical protein